MVLKSEEIKQVRNKSEYDEDTKKWFIPAFILRGKEMTLPKIKKMQVKSAMDVEKENREIEFTTHNNGFRATKMNKTQMNESSSDHFGDAGVQK